MFFQKSFQQEELPEKSRSSCFFYNTPANGSYPLHCHSYYELSYIVRGERYELVNGADNRVADNSLVFIPPLAFHSNRNVTASDILIIQFSPNFLCGNTSLLGADKTLSRPENSGWVIKPSGSTLDTLNKIKAFCESYPDGGTTVAAEFMRNSLLLELLYGMIEAGELVISADGGGVATRVAGLDSVINYIISHPDSRTDMKQAAKIANMSYYAFSRMFKEVIGVNFSDYCNTLRVRLAEELLITTDLPVSEISARVGIDTQSYFSRLFKQVNGSTPAAFRAKNAAR